MIFGALACMQDGLWSSSNYINIHAPLSPCVTVQWTIREAEVLNIPCGFLVEGDIILLRPGQIVPARCHAAQVSVTNIHFIRIIEAYSIPIKQDVCYC